jgi:hypothetical protein
MSHDISTQSAPTIIYDSDNSFQVPLFELEEKTYKNYVIILNQQSEIINLYKTILLDLSNQVHQLKLVVNSRTSSFSSHSRSNFSCNCINNNHIDQHPHTYSSFFPMCSPQFNQQYASQPVQMKSFHHFDALNNNVHQLHYLEDAVNKANAALELREIENINLKKEIDELRSARTLPDQISSDASASSSQYSRTLPFAPIVISSQPPSGIDSANTCTATSIMSFTMPPTNSLSTFSGKENEMPTKFTIEPKLRQSGLVGYN